MRKINITVVTCILFFVFLNISHSDLPLNIIVIIDTSDRVSTEKHPNQRERDIEILKETVKQFEKLFEDEIAIGEKIKNHKLTFIVPKQPRVLDPPNEIISKLTIEAPRKRSGNPKFQERRQELIEAIPKLYDHVQQHQQTGSDIWDWFRSQAEPSFLQNYQNLIICLSDGYLNFDIDIQDRRPRGTYMRVGALRDDPEAVNKIRNGSEALRSVNRDFSTFNIKFLMLEIRLREDDGVTFFQDSDIIQMYWKTWLNAMGIQNTKFQEQLGIGGVRNIVRNFIS